MRRIARAKANQMTRPVSPVPSIQTLDQISEEERQEILKFVETEQTEVNVCPYMLLIIIILITCIRGKSSMKLQSRKLF